MLRDIKRSNNESNIHEGVLRSVLGNAARHKNSIVALEAFELLQYRSISDFIRVIYTEPGISIENDLIDQVLRQECPANIDIRSIGVLLKCCQRRHDFELRKRVWSWAGPRLNSTHGDLDLTFITVYNSSFYAVVLEILSLQEMFGNIANRLESLVNRRLWVQ